MCHDHSPPSIYVEESKSPNVFLGYQVIELSCRCLFMGRGRYSHFISMDVKYCVVYTSFGSNFNIQLSCLLRPRLKPSTLRRLPRATIALYPHFYSNSSSASAISTCTLTPFSPRTSHSAFFSSHANNLLRLSSPSTRSTSPLHVHGVARRMR